MSEAVVATPAGAAQASEQTQQAPNIILPTTEDKAVDDQIEKIMTGSRRNVNAEILMQSVKLYPYHVEMEIGGIIKSISLMDFKEILDQQLQIDTKLEPMSLPPNTYLFAKGGGMLQLSCYYPERKATLKHGARYDQNPLVYKNVLLPNVIITHTLKLEDNVWLVTDTRYLCTSRKMAQITEQTFMTRADKSTETYRMPFPNFYEDFRMCYGQNTPPMRYNNNLRGLDYFYQLIETAPFNSDLGINVPRFRDNIPGWFKHLQTVETFPYDMLSRARADW